MTLSSAYEKHPQHRIEIDAEQVALRVSLNGEVLAETTRGLNLREGKYSAIVYVPREDVNLERLEASDHTTHCPFKGDASYFDYPSNDQSVGAVQQDGGYPRPSRVLFQSRHDRAIGKLNGGTLSLRYESPVADKVVRLPGSSNAAPPESHPSEQSACHRPRRETPEDKPPCRARSPHRGHSPQPPSWVSPKFGSAKLPNPVCSRLKLALHVCR